MQPVLKMKKVACMCVGQKEGYSNNQLPLIICYSNNQLPLRRVTFFYVKLLALNYYKYMKHTETYYKYMFNYFLYLVLLLFITGSHFIIYIRSTTVIFSAAACGKTTERKRP